MYDRRYSVFISSTYEDLRDERRAVQDAVLSAGDFPVQMESFPASDDDQFEFIKSLIDKCDYYVLILAGRYGTPAADGVSYTEKEYHYAKSKGIPILVMLHAKPGSIAAEKTEQTDKGKQRLANFVNEVSSGRLRQTWLTTGDLKHAVRDALDHAKATRQRVGWVRGDTTASAELLKEMNDVRRENEKFRQAIGNLELELALPPIPSADEMICIDLLPTTLSRGYQGSVSGVYAKVRCSWISAFPVVYSNLDWNSNDWNDERRFYLDREASCNAIGAGFASELASFNTKGLYTVSSASLERLISYFTEVGLMVATGDNPFTEAGARIARRFRIAHESNAQFFVVEGKIATKNVAASDKNFDDEIPF